MRHSHSHSHNTLPSEGHSRSFQLLFAQGPHLSGKLLHSLLFFYDWFRLQCQSAISLAAAEFRAGLLFLVATAAPATTAVAALAGYC